MRADLAQGLLSQSLRCKRRSAGPVDLARLEGFDDQALLDNAGRHFDAGGPTIDHRGDRLKVGLEGSLGRRSDLFANAAEVLGFAAIAELSADGGAGPSEIADTGHEKRV